MSATAFATPFALEEAGVTIDVPDGMTAEDVSDDCACALAISVDENDALKYAYTLSYMEAYEGKQLEDLTEEEAEGLVAGVAAALENPAIKVAQPEGSYPLLVVANEDGTQLHCISLLNGWLCDAAAGKFDGAPLDRR